MFKYIFSSTLLLTSTLCMATQDTVQKTVFGYSLSQESINFLDDNVVLQECCQSFIETVCPQFNTQITQIYSEATRKEGTIRVFLVIIDILEILHNECQSFESQKILYNKIQSLYITHFSDEPYKKMMEEHEASKKTSKEFYTSALTSYEKLNIQLHVHNFFNILASHKNAPDELKPLFKKYENKVITLVNAFHNYLKNVDTLL
ncbi:hypothetical protein K9K77_01205 [Candidatus Babeliales bacterium]|nr:hypothetical protein [Candidatus Babeliales bacterium]